MRYLFLLLSVILYTGFMLLDFTGSGYSTPVKYASVILCLLASLRNLRTRDGSIVVLALACTAAADWFLLIQNRYYLTGVLLFLAAQTAYCARLALCRGGICRMLLPVRVFPVLLLFFINTLTAVSALYFMNLCCNAVEAWSLSGRPMRIFAAGLTLFACCDICVGAYNLGLLTSFTGVGMWMFYLPSQVCIVLSVSEREA